MSGGIAYVLDPTDEFKNGNCNMEMINFEKIERNEAKELKQLIKNHLKYTQSELAYRILDDWENYLPQFVKVMPTDYKKALERIAEEQMSNSTSIA